MKKFMPARASALLLSFAMLGCAGQAGPSTHHPSVAPATQPAVALELNGPPIAPMYRELLAIDLPTLIRVANTRNLDILQARARIEADRGRYESKVEAILPVIAPALAYSHFQGVGQNANGTLTTPVHFDNLVPGISVEWVLNPGTIVYDIIASRRRLEASVQQEQSVSLETTRAAVVQYYDMALAQAQLQVAQQAVSEAQELLRITQLQVKTGTGLPANELRAQAQLAANQQDVVVALNSFYQASTKLTLTLHLEPTITLVPAVSRIDQVTLVKGDIPIEDLLATAVHCRPDLEAFRRLHLASQGDVGSTIWGGIGPQLQAGYTADSLKTSTAGGGKGQQKAGVGAGFALGMTTFGNLKTAQANEHSASLDVQRQLDFVRSEVVSAQQNSITHEKLIPVARQQLDSAREALRLTQASLQAGTALVIDVLQAQDAADDARLRYVAAVIHYNQSQVNLLAALGLLDPASLSLEHDAVKAAAETREPRESVGGAAGGGGP